MKTKLGISAGFIGALAFILAFASMQSWTVVVALLLVVGYVFLNEQNDWLKFTVVKALLLVVLFFGADGLIMILPKFLSAISSLLGMVGVGTVVITRISDFFYFILYLLEAAYMVLTLLLAFVAPKIKSINIKPIDKLVNKIMLTVSE